MSAVEIPRHRWTRDEYALLYESDLRCELIEGEIVDMSPTKPRHIAVTMRIARVLSGLPRLASAAIASQSPIVLGDTSEPEPDIWVARGPDHTYADRKAEPPDLLLVIEVSDTTLIYDRNVKIPLYARSGIATSWIVDVTANTITVFSAPADGIYDKVTEYGAGQQVPLPWGDTLDVSTLLFLDEPS